MSLCHKESGAKVSWCVREGGPDHPKVSVVFNEQPHMMYLNGGTFCQSFSFLALTVLDWERFLETCYPLLNGQHCL